MFKLIDWTDLGQPIREWDFKGASAVDFDLLTDIRSVYDDDIIINGKPNPVFFEDMMDFG